MRYLYDEIKQYLSFGNYPFHMPGHKGNSAFFPPLPLSLLDVTELELTDNLYEPKTCIKKTQERIANIYGADESFLLVGGATAGITAAITAVLSAGELLAVARNCHRSVFAGMAVSGAVPLYFLPDNTLYNIFGAVSEKTVKQLLNKNEKIKAVIITSPTYEGVVSDIKSIADTVHSNGCILIVDEAHGAHFPFHEVFPQNALKQGADIVVNSFHKTLPAFSQSAVLHIQGQRVDKKRILQCLSLVQTSSPSYLIMASTDYMLNKISGDKSYFDSYAEDLIKLRTALGARLLQLPNSDIGKLLISIKNGSAFGKKHRLAFEAVTDNYVLAMTSVADTKEGFERLQAAVASYESTDNTADSPADSPYMPEMVLSPREALGKKVRRVKVEESIGELAGELIMKFPPGIPLFAPGERIDKNILEYKNPDCEIDILLL